MKYRRLKNLLFLLLIVLLNLIGHITMAQPKVLESYTWKKRVLLVFTSHSKHALYQEQIKAFEKATAGVLDRDLVIFKIVGNQGFRPDNKPLSKTQNQQLRKYYKVPQMQFQVILIGKDGGEKMRTIKKVMDVKRLFRTIDAMPMRRSEMHRKGK
ncbi:hypothetical protein BKI52_07100 [marine bacterium AO1-C]|nr:hypothetical protein BKI52_07100 [marine bacterium AO1-C]